MSDLLNAVDPAQDDVPPPQPAKGATDTPSAPGGSGPTNSMPDLGLDMPMLMDAVDMGGGSKPKDASQTPSSKQGAPTVEVKKATESEAAFEKLFQSTPTPAPTDVKPLNKPLMAVASNDIQGKHDFFSSTPCTITCESLVCGLSNACFLCLALGAVDKLHFLA